MTISYLVSTLNESYSLDKHNSENFTQKYTIMLLSHYIQLLAPTLTNDATASPYPYGPHHYPLPSTSPAPPALISTH